MNDIFQYNGVDWLMFVLIVVHLWAVGDRKRSAFLFGAFAGVAGMLFGFMVDSLATVAMNCVFIGLHVRAWINWK